MSLSENIQGPAQLFVARQPIFRPDKTIYGYEILFRSGFSNYFDPSVDQDYASGRSLSDVYMNFGIDVLTGQGRAFINFTRSHLVGEVPMIFPKDHLVVEVLENVEPTPELVHAVRKLKDRGYTIALDDFVYHGNLDQLIEMADIIKVDFIVTKAGARAEVVKRLKRKGLTFLAEKVETNEEFLEAGEMGYTLFQGYFFSKPQILEGKEVPGFKLNYLEIIKELNREETDFKKLENLVRRDLGLSYKFLRFINSAHFGFTSEITSIAQALMILGTRGIRTWLNLVALTALADDKPKELVFMALTRALFLEKLCEETDFPGESGNLFIVGLFSVIDAILDRPMEAIVATLPLPEEVRDALTGKPGRFGALAVLMRAYEEGRWEDLSALCLETGFEESLLPAYFMKAVSEATNVVRAIG